MHFLVVNYHHIDEENRYRHPGVYPVSPQRLERQIALLGKHFRFVGQEDIKTALDGGRPLPPWSCAITFDDGVRNQYENALPVLDGLGVPAIFFVNGLPYGERKVLRIHKVNWCRAHIEPDAFWEKIKEYYRGYAGNEFDFDRLKIPEKVLEREYHYDSMPERKVKYVLRQGIIDNNLRNRIIDSIFSEVVADEPDFVKGFYMSEDQIRDLHSRGYLGTHTYSHEPLARLGLEAAVDEVIKCVEVVSKIVKADLRDIYSFSYPYGNDQVLSLSIAAAVEKSGLRLGFTGERCFNKGLEHPLLLARIDSNEAPAGKSPCFEINRDNQVVITGGNMHMFRSEHVTE